MINETNDGNRMNRGRFLGFIGKIGVLTFLTSIPVFAAEAKLKRPVTAESKTVKLTPGKLQYRTILRSPTIKGKLLSKAVLEEKLTTKNLENLRDLLTGRFFGKAAEDVFKNGYVPMINWSLGSEGSDSGCFLNACANLTPSSCPSFSQECTVQLRSHVDQGELIIDIVNSTNIPNFGNQSDCNTYCSGQCNNDNGCGHKCDERCSHKTTVGLGELVSYPSDKFASELLKILGSTDLGVVQRELRDVIFSDQVLNLGLQHIILAAHDGIAGGLESGQLAY
jgi:hypothetical protein